MGVQSFGGLDANGVARFTVDGHLDAGFVGGDLANTPCSGRVTSMALSPSGQVLVGGPGSIGRLLASGAFDLGFGSGGCVQTMIPGNVSGLWAERDGNILFVAGPQSGLLERLRPDGSIDSTFGVNGALPLFAGNQPMSNASLLLQPDGSIIAIGTVAFPDLAAVSQAKVALIRLTPDGTLDTSFGAGGTAIADFGGSGFVGAFASSGALQPDGKIVIAATTEGPPIFPNAPGPQVPIRLTGVGVARFNVDGTPDLTFAGRGGTMLWSQYGSIAGFIAVRPDGRILIGSSVATTFNTVHFSYLVGDLALFQLQGGSGTALHPYREASAIEYFFGGFGHYFITADPYEIVNLDTGNSGWTRTGKSFKVWTESASGLSPACRFFSGQTFAPKSSHFYTPYPAECAALKQGSAWEFEGDVFDLALPMEPPGQGTCTAGSAPLYRVYNNGQGGAPNHRYTDDLVVLDQMVAQGWSFEGEAQTKVFSCIPSSL